MRLRARLTLSVAALAVPIVVVVSALGYAQIRRGIVDAAYEATVARMSAGGLERCERAPRAFARRLERRARRRGRPGGLRRGRARARLLGVYDAAYRPSGGAPPLDPALREALVDGEEVAARWLREPRRVRIAMRMPWDGPCAVLLVERATGRETAGGFRRILGWASLVAALTALAAFAALGPVVRRIRGLERAVRDQASSGYAEQVEVRGADEVAALAQAFNAASAEIRAQLSQLAARERALTRYLQSTTHDVMVPLTVLQGHLSELRRRRDEPPDPARLRGALEESHYLAALLRNLAAAARLEGGEPMLSRHRFDLRDVLERVIARHRPIAEEREVHLNHAVPEAPVTVVADRTLVEQALGNLVHNAIVYNAAGGHVAVILEPAGEAGFELRVRDDGPGLPEDELARVHERRFRGGEARSRRPTGLGLGLHIVRDVAGRHGFALTFASPPEGGLEVTLRGARDQPAAEA